jgi:hypothetical protein
MAGTVLTIRGGGRSWQVDLKPEGAVIGRSPGCDVVIDSPDVSRRHARIFRSSPDRWTIEDLGSSNGIFINGERLVSRSIMTGDVIEIGPALLSLGQTSRVPADEAVSSTTPRVLVEDFGTEVFYDRPRIEDCVTPPCPGRLKIARERLSGMADQDEAYAEACRLLAQGGTAAAAVFRVPTKAWSMPKTPAVLACHFGVDSEDTVLEGGRRAAPWHYGLRISRRLLEAVRVETRPLMTKSIFSCDSEITISLVDEHSPRALICVPLDRRDQTIDLLYVDVSLDERTAPGAEETFAFVQAVAREARTVPRPASDGCRSSATALR